jgi:hypothetical protein
MSVLLSFCVNIFHRNTQFIKLHKFTKLWISQFGAIMLIACILQVLPLLVNTEWFLINVNQSDLKQHKR